VGRLVGGVALLLLALVMLYGFARSEVAPSAPATIAALLLTVALPGGIGLALIRSHLGRGRRLAGSRDELRRRTVDAELLRLAERHGGRLTVVEVVRDLALPPEEAKAALDAMHARELAELEITDSGVIVYAFHDVRRLGEKDSARGLLDA
jgi:hypothetical protein